jgi:hypothetical protein
MYRRGVRRIFSIWVKTHRVCEWSPKSESWLLLEPGTRIEDLCLVAPLAVAALLDAAKADYAVVEALAAKGSPAIREREAAAEAKGEIKGKIKGRAEAVLAILEARAIPVSEAQRQEILGCRDLDRLSRWLRQAILASSAGEVTSET